PRAERAIDMPAELAEALEADPELAEAFQALTPGRQKSYLFNLAQARKSATRIARIEKFRDRILAGKGAQER
ncbi:MAG: YdeI/OmpD-associated family protein, partial [Rhodobacteraceae bacterium]|nr:YdeI/OmpD-associated family protein [Paracoccaceae bacterium]